MPVDGDINVFSPAVKPSNFNAGRRLLFDGVQSTRHLYHVHVFAATCCSVFKIAFFCSKAWENDSDSFSDILRKKQ